MKRLATAIAVLPALPSASVAQVAPAPVTMSRPGDVIIDFHGGNAGRDIADALAALTTQDGMLGTVDVVVEKGDNACSILVKRNFPPACTAMMPSIVRLNSKGATNLSKLQPGDHILMPDIRIEVRTATRNVSDQERSLAERKIIFNWAGISIRTMLGQNQITYNAYRMYIPNSSEGAARKTLGLLKQKLGATTNVSFDIAAFSPIPAPLHSVQGGEGGCPSAMYRYGDLLDPDTSLDPFIPAPGPKRPSVYLIDTILNSTPDLPTGAAQPGVDATCLTVAFNSARHHATLLAGIVASARRVRFVGLAPEAKIKALDWIRPDGSSATGVYIAASPNSSLTSDIERIGADPTITVRPIFLAATEFPLLDAGQAEKIADDADARKDYSPNVPIFQHAPLIITSAGQRNPGDTSTLWRISPNYATSPQNLGDLDNVVLVTACVQCRPSLVTILNDSLRPVKNTVSTITLVAPGGAPIPGWVDANSVSSAAGTSQAAAYVAGVAAEMISRYPEIYRESWRVKYWLSATAWPLVGGFNSDDASFVVEMGLVDPQRALLDPSFAWVKDRSGTWHKLKLKKWVQPTLQMQDGGAQEEDIATGSVARIVNVAPAGTTPKFAVLRKPGSNKRMERLGWLTFMGSYSIERCDGGSPVQLDQVDDLILPLNRLPTSCD